MKIRTRWIKSITINGTAHTHASAVLISDMGSERRLELEGVISFYFSAALDDHSEYHVLTTNFKWQPEQIASWRCKEYYWLHGQYDSEVEQVKRYLKGDFMQSWRFDRNINANFVYLFFYFYSIEATRRDEALPHLKTVYELITLELLEKIATILQWSTLDFLEFKLKAEGK